MRDPKLLVVDPLDALLEGDAHGSLAGVALPDGLVSVGVGEVVSAAPALAAGVVLPDGSGSAEAVDDEDDEDGDGDALATTPHNALWTAEEEPDGEGDADEEGEDRPGSAEGPLLGRPDGSGPGVDPANATAAADANTAVAAAVRAADVRVIGVPPGCSARIPKTDRRVSTALACHAV